MDEHSNPSEKAQQLSRKRRRGLTRIAAACERCRRRKQKCDSKSPTCGPCAAAGARCVLSSRLVVQSAPDCNCESLRLDLEELQRCNDALSLELANEKKRNDASRASISSSRSGPFGFLHDPSGAQNQPTEGPESPLIHENYSGRILRPTFTGGNGHRGIAADILGSAWNLWNNDTSTETPDQHTMSTDGVAIHQYGEALIKVYFDKYWAHLPILHRPTFMNEHYYPISSGASGMPFSEFQVYMVLAIAACEKRTTSTSRYTFSHRELFQKAVGFLGAVVASDDLDYIQGLLLLCTYGRNEPQSVNMWHTTGLALRTALGIDLHRQEYLATRNLYEAEMAKRLFWSVYVLDRSMAMALGRPLGIVDSDITLPLPLQYTDDQLSGANPESVEPNSLPDPSDTSTFIHVIKIRRINANAYKTFHSAGNTSPTEALETLQLQYYSQLNEWLMGAPRYFATGSMFQSLEWFQIAYHHAVLSLYRPSQAIPVPRFQALQLCADSSISLISSYASLYAKNRVSYSFIALNSIFMAAITMLYALRASPIVRQELSKEVTETNLASCLALFRGISNGREIAERCSAIVGRLGKATLALFDSDVVSDQQVDIEFLSWFGLRSQHSSLLATRPNIESEPAFSQNDFDLNDHPTIPSVDGAWRDFFAQGFDWESSAAMEFLPMSLQ